LGSSQRSSYDLVTVNWHPRQTKVWKFHVKQSCPQANVVLLPNKKMFEWNWSSGKLCCFKYLDELKHPGRFIYVDTDTIITHELADIFDRMDDAVLSLSSDIPATGGMSRWAKPEAREARAGCDLAFGLDPAENIVHYSSGLMALRGLDPRELGEKWAAAMIYPMLRARFGRALVYEEIALSYVIAADRIPVHHQPLWMHGNILRRAFFGHCRAPWVIHYHNERRLRAQRLERYLDID
jgi:hypothetical protein